MDAADVVRDLIFNCPRCPRKLAFVTSWGTRHDVTRVYACPEHGQWLLPPHGRFEPRPATVH